MPEQTPLSPSLELIKDPESFLKRVQELNKDPDLNDHCEVELKDGRTVEPYSTNLRSEGRRIWDAFGFFAISPSASKPSKLCGTVRKNFVSWRKTFVKCFLY